MRMSHSLIAHVPSRMRTNCKSPPAISPCSNGTFTNLNSRRRSSDDARSTHNVPAISAVRFRSGVGSKASPINSARFESLAIRKQWSLANAGGQERVDPRRVVDDGIVALCDHISDAAQTVRRQREPRTIDESCGDRGVLLHHFVAGARVEGSLVRNGCRRDISEGGRQLGGSERRTHLLPDRESRRARIGEAPADVSVRDADRVERNWQAGDHDALRDLAAGPELDCPSRRRAKADAKRPERERAGCRRRDAEFAALVAQCSCPRLRRRVDEQYDDAADRAIRGIGHHPAHDLRASERRSERREHHSGPPRSTQHDYSGGLFDFGS